MEKKERHQEEIIVTEEAAGQRLDAFLAELLTDQSRSQLQKQINEHKILLNNSPARPKDRVKAGDQISGELDSPRPVEFDAKDHLTPAEIPLNILYEDEDIIVIDKPHGLTVHPGAGTGGETTLVEGLMYYLGKKNPEDVKDLGLRPGIVHRLDKDTSGVLVCAKNETAHQNLAKQFAEKTNFRQYVALLQGDLKNTQEIESYLGRDRHHRLKFVSMPAPEYHRLSEKKIESDGYRYARTKFFVERRYEIDNLTLTLSKAELFTGRTHQIRVHARALGTPVLGDPLYGYKIPPTLDFLGKIRRQMLHAMVLGFSHPTSGRRLAFEADLPHDFLAILESLNSLAR